MKLLLCNPRGFCAGVDRAISTVEKAIELFTPPIYIKHQIVHNKHVVKYLEDKGAIFVDSLEEVPSNSYVIFSAHGVSPKVRQEAIKRNLNVIDATCPLVTKVHSAAKVFAKKGYKIILIGHKRHVEVIGTKEEANDVTVVVENIKDVESLNFKDDQKLAYLTQTTLSIDDVKEIVEALTKKFPNITTIPSSSICYATMNRQRAICNLSNHVDIVFVVGDPTSSNSNRLKEIVVKRKTKAYLINSKDEIDPKWLSNVRVIGMTAGASTPEAIVQSCVDRLIELGVKEVKEDYFVEENISFSLPKEICSCALNK